MRDKSLGLVTPRCLKRLFFGPTVAPTKKWLDVDTASIRIHVLPELRSEVVRHEVHESIAEGMLWGDLLMITNNGTIEKNQMTNPNRPRQT